MRQSVRPSDALAGLKAGIFKSSIVMGSPIPSEQQRWPRNWSHCGRKSCWAWEPLPLSHYSARAAQIPIVFIGVPDPIGAGFVASLARPGGNLTGTLLNEPSVVGKWLAMLKEIRPQLARTAVLFNPKTSPYRSAYGIAAAARSLAIELVECEIAGAPDIERNLSDFAHAAANGGLLVPPDFTAWRSTAISLRTGREAPASRCLHGPILG